MDLRLTDKGAVVTGARTTDNLDGIRHRRRADQDDLT